MDPPELEVHRQLETSQALFLLPFLWWRVLYASENDDAWNFSRTTGTLGRATPLDGVTHGLAPIIG